MDKDKMKMGIGEIFFEGIGAYIRNPVKQVTRAALRAGLTIT